MKRIIALSMALIVLLATMLPVLASDTGNGVTGYPFQIYKVKNVNDNGGGAFPGVTYHIYKDSALIESVTTDENGLALSSELPFGTYVIEEVTPEGYEPIEPMTINMTGYGDSIIRISGTYISGHVIINVSGTDGSKVKGAEFSVYKPDDTWVGDFVSGNNGAAVYAPLLKGDYYAVQKSAPAGYIADTGQYPVSIVTHNQSVSHDVMNERVSGSAKVITTDNSGNPLPGVAYGIYDSKSVFIEELTTGADGTAISGTLYYGDYELRESSPADGHEPMEQSVPFRISEHGVTVEIPVSAAASSGSVRVIKTDGGGNPIPGVKFALHNNADLFLEELITGADGTAMSGSLVKGDYYLLETEAAAGFVPITERIPFSITANGEVVEKTVVNSLGSQTLRVTATGSDLGNPPLPGAVFAVYRDSDDSMAVGLTAGADGTAETTLPLGEYYLVQTQTAAGYLLPQGNFPFSLTAHGSAYELEVQNEPIPAPENGLLELTKKSSATEEPLSGAVFGLYDAATDTPLATLTTDGGGRVAYELPEGAFYLSEQTAPEGFVLNAGRINFNVISGETAAVTVFNEPAPPQAGHIRVVKVMEGTGMFLQGAVFGVYSADTDAQVDTITTGSDGTATSIALPAGAFYLRELAAPAGFTPITANIDVTVTAGVISETYVYNAPVPANGFIRLTKLEEGSNKPLANVTFGIYEAAGHTQTGELTTGTDGTALSGELTAGIYYLVELAGLDGYRVTTEKTGITVKPGETAEITVYNALLPTAGYIQLTKKAEGTDTPLQGAVFGVYTASGDVKAASLTTGADGTALSGELTAGDYYLIEEQAPSGFKPNADKINVTVKVEETANVIVYNAPMPNTGFIQLTKKAEGTDTPLQGAAFGVYAVSGDVKAASLTTGADGTALSGELTAGDYYLLEEQAPSGFKPNADKISVTVKAEETANVVIYNAPLPTTGYIQLIKKAEGTDTPLQGAVFGVYTASGDVKVAELTTGADGIALSGELPAADYYLLEQKSPNGYGLDTEKAGVTVKAGETASVTVFNAPLPPPSPTTGYIQLIKKAAGSNAPLSGAVFGVYTASGDIKVAELTTGADGTAISGELPAADYYLLEQKSPDGYSLNTDKTGVTVTAGNTASLTVFNTPLPVESPIPKNGYIRIIKRAEGTNAPLQGAVFGVYTVSGDVKVAELTTGANGTTLSGELPAADYYLMEQKSPDGYSLNSEKTGVTVKAGETAEKTVFNSVAVESGHVRIIKRAEKTGVLLPGASFSIHKAEDDAKISDLTTGADGMATSAALPAGAYYLLEKQAPAGFKLNADRIYFTVSADETKEMTITNAPEETEKPLSGYVKINKTAAGTGAKLPGAIFGLYEQGSDKKISELITGTDGTATSAALPDGDFYLLELTAPTGYQLSPEKVEFRLNAGETKEFTVINALAESVTPTGNLHLTKKAEITGQRLSGAVFGVYNALTNAKSAEITTGADGTAVCELPESSYYLLEQTAPAGFIPEPAQIPFVIVAGNTIKVEVTNMTEKGAVRLSVKDTDGFALEGAAFGVYDANDRNVAVLTTDGGGKAVHDLSSGVYYMLEQSPPSGYPSNTEKYSFYVTAGQTADVLVLKQASAPTPAYEIPKTGEAFPWLNYGMAALCLSVAAVLSAYGLRSRRTA